MTISELIKFIWDGVDIPVTKEEIQHSVNVFTYGLRNRIVNDEEVQELNTQYKIDIYDKEHKLFNEH